MDAAEPSANPGLHPQHAGARPAHPVTHTGGPGPDAERSGHPGGHPGHPGTHPGPRPEHTGGRPGTHPGGHPGHPGGPSAPVHETVRRSTSRGTIAASAALGWGAALSTALLFERIGAAIDARGLSEAGLALLIALALIAAICAGAGAWLTQWAESQTERKLRRAVVSRVFDLGVTATTNRSGELLSLGTAAVERAAHYRAGFIGPILAALTTPLLVIGVMAITVDLVTAGWLALLVLLVPLLIGGFQKLVRPIGGAYRRSQARLTAGFLEAVQALETLVYARAAARVGDDLAERGEAHRRRLMKLLAGNQLLIFVVDAAFSLTVVVAASAIAVSRVGSGSLSLGSGIAIVMMSTLVIGPVDVVGQFFYIGIGGRAAQRQIGAHLAAPPDRRASGSPARIVRTPEGARDAAGAKDATSPGSESATVPGAKNAAAPAGGIVLEEVTAGWPGGPPILRGLSMRIEPGERVALVGPSGIGKSTVSALIQGHLLPRSGTVSVDGLDTRTTDPSLVRARLAVVEQRAFLFLGSIADNLRLAAPAATNAELWEALESAGLRDEISALPLGLDAPVGEQGSLLSGGQAQRLAIARAWLRDAPILLLDEPTSQVDLSGEAAILEALDRLARGRTVLMIAHRPGAILSADRVIRLAGTGAAA